MLGYPLKIFDSIKNTEKNQSCAGAPRSKLVGYSTEIIFYKETIAKFKELISKWKEFRYLR